MKAANAERVLVHQKLADERLGKKGSARQEWAYQRGKSLEVTRETVDGGKAKRKVLSKTEGKRGEPQEDRQVGSELRQERSKNKASNPIEMRKQERNRERSQTKKRK